MADNLIPLGVYDAMSDDARAEYLLSHLRDKLRTAKATKSVTP